MHDSVVGGIYHRPPYGITPSDLLIEIPGPGGVRHCVNTQSALEVVPYIP
jgi:hypothetical protein